MTHRSLTAADRKVRTAIVLIAGAGALLGPLASPIGVDNLALDAALDSVSRTLHATIRTSVRTPVGAIGVGGRAQLSYGCDGTIAGSVEYPRLVRALARVRGVTLVREVRGGVEGAAAARCELPADTLSGNFSIADSVVTGTVVMRGHARPVTGTVRSPARHEYDASVRLSGGTDDRTLSLHLR